VFRRAEGLETALHVPHVKEIQITAKPDQQLFALPEGSSYLGFIFARAESAAFAERAVREAHARLRFTIDPLIALSPA
jgi:L-amino acid ligase C-terminal domain 2